MKKLLQQRKYRNAFKLIYKNKELENTLKVKTLQFLSQSHSPFVQK
jgi:hypothetical protein